MKERDEKKSEGGHVLPKKKKKSNAFLIVLIIFFLIIAILAGYICISKLLNDGKSRREYQRLKSDVTKDGDDELPLHINWDELLAINDDIIGWIYIGSVNISYPIMKTDDNDFYLHRNMYKEWLDAGSIFLDMNNKTDFSDPNSVIYGHNMIDGSMFGKLGQILYQNAAKDNPYFWILTPNGNYKYQIFSAFATVPETRAYRFFPERNEAFVNWAYEMQQQSGVPFEQLQHNEDENVATLSTCGATSAERTIVLGVCINGPIPANAQNQER